MIRTFTIRTTLLLFIFCTLSSKTSNPVVKENKEEPVPTGVMSFLTTRDGNFEIYTTTADGKI